MGGCGRRGAGKGGTWEFMPKDCWSTKGEMSVVPLFDAELKSTAIVRQMKIRLRTSTCDPHRPAPR